VIGSGSHFFVPLIVTLDCALQLAAAVIRRITVTLVDDVAFDTTITRNTPWSDTLTDDVAFDVTAASAIRFTFTDTLDVAVSVTLARAILCAATDVDDVAVDETTMLA
jgi:uncharacterized protein with von Willebrand factor type A (vWA) domain